MGGLGIKDCSRYITGYGATAVAVSFLIHNRTDLPIVATSIYFILTCVTDTHKSKIPNLLNLSLAIFGIGINSVQNGWPGSVHSLLGMMLGIGLLFVPYLMGGFGAGDVKALGAIGAVTGPGAVLNVFVYMAFFGGVMAIFHYILNRNLIEKSRQLWSSIKITTISREATDIVPNEKERLRFPYAAAIALGYYSYLTWGTFL